MGTDVRLLAPDRAGLDDARDWLASFDARLSRFRERQRAVRAQPRSPLHRSRVGAAAHGGRARACGPRGARAASSTRPCCPRCAAPGYAASLAGVAPAGLAAALAAAPPRRAARPHPAARWRRVHVDDARGAVRRPPGVELDTGGTGKGLAADAVAHRLARTRALRGRLRRRPARRRRRRAAAGRTRSRSPTPSAASPSIGCGWARARSRPRASTRASGSGPTGPSPTTSSTR